MKWLANYFPHCVSVRIRTFPTFSGERQRQTYQQPQAKWFTCTGKRGRWQQQVAEQKMRIKTIRRIKCATTCGAHTHTDSSKVREDKRERKKEFNGQKSRTQAFDNAWVFGSGGEMRTVAINFKSGAMTIHLIFSVPRHCVTFTSDSIRCYSKFSARFRVPSHLNLKI